MTTRTHMTRRSFGKLALGGTALAAIGAPAIVRGPCPILRTPLSCRGGLFLDLHGAAPFATVTFETDGSRRSDWTPTAASHRAPFVGENPCRAFIPALVSKQAPASRVSARRVSSRLLD